jgi:hypothetical protein
MNGAVSPALSALDARVLRATDARRERSPERIGELAGCAADVALSTLRRLRVRDLVEDDGERLGLLALAIPLVVFREQGALAGDGGAVVAGGDELFQPELIEVGSEVLEEVALEGVVAVAVDDLATEGIGVELKVGLDFFLYVNVLSVELVLLRRLRGVQASI